MDNIYANTSWESYNVYRPAYPQSLWDLIISHVQSNTGTFEAAHDIGAGAGQAASVLAQHFSTVYVSDPAEHNISTARQHLSSSTREHSCDIRFDVRSGEADPTAEDWIKPRSLDLITICAAMHWMDADTVVKNAAKSLKPRGTMALVYYALKPIIADNAEAEDVWRQLMATVTERRMKASPSIKRARHHNSIGLDFVGFPEEDWNSTRRVYINTSPEPDDVWKAWTWMDIESVPNRRREDDTTETVEDEASWSKVADQDWFEGYLETTMPLKGESGYQGDEEKMMDQLKAVIGDGQVMVVWPVEVLLATRS